MDLDYIEIGKRLRDIRGSLSQSKFGEQLGYGNGYVRNCELGKKPSLEYLTKIKDHFQYPLEWILYGENPIGLDVDNKYPPELEEMFSVLKYIMADPDPDLHAWAKIQFKKAFAEYYELLGLDKSKRRSSTSTNTDEDAATTENSNIA